MKPFLYAGQTELSRICFGVEFIGSYNKWGLMISFLWWFIMPGLERK